MPTSQPLDLSLYVVAPRVSVPAAVSLGIALLSATPKPTPQAVRRAATRLRESVLTLQQGWRRQVSTGFASLATPKEVDTRVDRAFRAMSLRLEALTILSADAGPDVEMATRAHQRLFPDGLRFLNLPHSQQWAHCDRLLATLDDDEDLVTDVERLVGETTLAEVRAAQQAYGTVLGITSARENADVVSLIEPLEAVRSAIVGYAVQIVAMQSDDPSRLPAAHKALAPIDEVRAAQGAQGRRSESPTPPPGLVENGVSVTPDTPVPVVEDEPAGNAAQT